MTRGLYLLALAACGANQGPIEEPTPTEKAPAATLACIPPTIGTRITNAVADGKRVRYCIADSDECFSLDPDNADVHSFVRVAKPAVVETGAYVETTPPRIEVCTSLDCTSLTTLVLPKLANITAATSPDGAFAAFLFGGEAPKGYVEVWDVARSRKLSTIRYAQDHCAEIAMLGETVLVKSAPCGALPRRGTLFTVGGKKLADVGGKSFTIGAYAHVDGNAWAFLDETATRIAVQDVARGTLARMIDTSGVFLIGGGKQGTPGESALVRLTDTRLAIVAGAPAVGSVATVDPKLGTVELRQAPLCLTPAAR